MRSAVVLLGLGLIGLIACSKEDDLRPRRNPYAGTCVAATDAQPDWPPCSTYCDARGASDCAATGGCRMIATAECSGGAFAMTTFVTCWATAGFEPERGSDCHAITDADECARHDDCLSVHNHTVCDGSSYVSEFLFCWPEDEALPPPPPPPPGGGLPLPD